jgi:2'-hydroxyisoflavone reductase
VTLINRNRTRPDFFKGRVEQLIGDLNADMSELKGRKFDVVIDIPTMYPYWVRNVAQYLTGNVGLYVFVSTESVYPDNSKPWADETDRLATVPEGVDPYMTPTSSRQYYGPLKAFCEQLVQKTYPASLIIRPGLIVGPLDPSDRFTYWPVRIDQGGEVMAPGTPSDPIQIIDSRDLAEWTIRMVENRETGPYNACGPAKEMGMGAMLDGIKEAIKSTATFTWVPADFLRENGIRGWSNMPVWMNPAGNNVAFSRKSNAKAVAKGLTFRPLAVTARDTLAWAKTRPAEQQQALAEGKIAGTSRAKETDVLAAWKAKKAGAP